MENRILPHLGPDWTRQQPQLPPEEAPRESTPHWLREQAENLIIDKPAVGLGMALALGVALGWLIKRR